jgi:hypothetical protein
MKSDDTEMVEDVVDRVESVPLDLDLDTRIDDMMKVFPSKGGISRDAIASLKESIMGLITESVKQRAVRATVSPDMDYGTESSSTYSARELSSVVTAVVKELVPVMSKALRENSTDYGSARYRGDLETLAKSFPVKPWKGPSDKAWENVRMDVKKAAKTHGCLEILDGTFTEPDGTDEEEELKVWKNANTKAIILLSNTFSEFEASNEIVQLFTEEDNSDGNALECWLELDSEFDDDGV